MVLQSKGQWRRNLLKRLHKKGRIKPIQRTPDRTPDSTPSTTPQSSPPRTSRIKFKKHIRKLSHQLSPKRRPRQASLSPPDLTHYHHGALPPSRRPKMLPKRAQTLSSAPNSPGFLARQIHKRRSKSLFSNLPERRGSCPDSNSRPRTSRSGSAASYFGRRWRRRTSALCESAVKLETDGLKEIHLSDVIRCPEKRSYFEEFLKREMCDENLKFLVACDAYTDTVDRLIEENTESGNSRNLVLGLANELFDNFLSNHSSTPVNISYLAKHPIQETLIAWSMYLRLERIRHLDEKYASQPEMLERIVKSEWKLTSWDLIDQPFHSCVADRPKHRRSASEPPNAFSTSPKNTSMDISGTIPEAIANAMHCTDGDCQGDGEDEKIGFWDLIDLMNNDESDVEAKKEVTPENEEAFLLPTGGFSWIEYKEKVYQHASKCEKFSESQPMDDLSQQHLLEIERRTLERELLEKMHEREVRRANGDGNSSLSSDDDYFHPALSWRLYGVFDVAYREVYQLLNSDCFKRFINEMEHALV